MFIIVDASLLTKSALRLYDKMLLALPTNRYYYGVVKLGW